MLCLSVDLAAGDLDSQAGSPPNPISLPSGSRKVTSGHPHESRVSCGIRCGGRARSGQQVCSAGAGYLLEHGVGELLDSGWQGDVAEGGGVGLAVVGEPVQEIDQCLPGGLAGLVGVQERPAVAGDGVAGGTGRPPVGAPRQRPALTDVGISRATGPNAASGLTKGPALAPGGTYATSASLEKPCAIRNPPPDQPAEPPTPQRLGERAGLLKRTPAPWLAGQGGGPVHKQLPGLW
jgi:hypothetical protein